MSDKMSDKENHASTIGDREIGDRAIGDTTIGDIDYAILKLLSYKSLEISEIANILQIRMLTIEKHVYELVKRELIVFQLQNNLVITNSGEDIIRNYETTVDNWKPIEDFISATITNRKQQKFKIYKILDIVLLLFMIVLILLIIYFGKDLF
jgi:predicted transcriptional regulator